LPTILKVECRDRRIQVQKLLESVKGAGNKPRWLPIFAIISLSLGRAMAPLPNPDSLDSNGNRPVPRHGIRIALHLSLLAACAVWLLEFISDKQWREQHPGAGASSVPLPLWILIVSVALPFVLYLLSVSLLSTRSEELIAAGAGIAAGISPFSMIFSVLALLGSMFFSFYPEPYFLPLAISLLVLFGSGVWMIVSAFRIGKVNWGAFLLAAGVTFISLAICAHKGMVP
jgi:hypothetical protein